MLKKIVAKYVACITAFDALLLSSLSGFNMIPFTWSNYTLTEKTNSILIISQCIISIVMIWYAWFKSNLRIVR
jgi:hypothetical protein